jgi:hypothetical protein
MGGKGQIADQRFIVQHADEGSVNCVVVNKVDLLSRSLLDFTRRMELFGQARSRIRPLDFRDDLAHLVAVQGFSLPGAAHRRN